MCLWVPDNFLLARSRTCTDILLTRPTCWNLKFGPVMVELDSWNLITFNLRFLIKGKFFCLIPGQIYWAMSGRNDFTPTQFITLLEFALVSNMTYICGIPSIFLPLWMQSKANNKTNGRFCLIYVVHSILWIILEPCFHYFIDTMIDEIESLISPL